MGRYCILYSQSSECKGVTFVGCCLMDIHLVSCCRFGNRSFAFLMISMFLYYIYSTMEFSIKGALYFHFIDVCIGEGESFSF